jgi:Rhamnan synthesis protein F
VPPEISGRHVLGEPITWRLLWTRFKRSEHRALALRNLGLHAVRALRRRLPVPARAAVSLALNFCRESRIQVEMAIRVPVGWVRSPHQILERWDAAERPLGENLVLFVHFDAEGRVLPATRAFLSSLAQTPVSVVFVTNSGHILDEDKAFLREVCSTILIRRNIGYDFGAWRDALDTLGLPRPGTRSIAMVNDSVYGPFVDMAPLLSSIDFGRADVWGLTESWQHHYHLQSFFLVCGEAAIRSDAWRRFWRSVRPVPSKDWIIRHCEIGFTGALARNGIRCAALFPQSDLLNASEVRRLRLVVVQDWADRGRDPRLRGRAVHARRILGSIKRGAQDLNPSIDLWRQLLHAGYPFVKRELLLKNPSKVTDVFDWESVVSLSLNADPRALGEELRRTLGGRRPGVWNSPSAEVAEEEKRRFD